MAPSSQSSITTLARYRPALLALTALAAGCGIYYIHGAFWTPSLRDGVAAGPQTTLHRSNARARRRPRGSTVNQTVDHRDVEESSTEQQPSTSVPYSVASYGRHLVTASNGNELPVDLVPGPLIQTSDLRERLGISEEEAAEARQNLEVAFLDAFLAREAPGDRVMPEAAQHFLLLQLRADGNYSTTNVADAIQRYHAGALVDHPQRLLRIAQQTRQQTTNAPLADGADEDHSPPAALEISADTDSDHSSAEDQDNDQKDNDDSHSILNLLYHIAADQARKEGFIHRGVTCNACNTHPIKGIRYRCANCYDYDLCEQCETMQVHLPTHLFYKIKIPAPLYGHPRQVQPVWYPGKADLSTHHLSKDQVNRLSKNTGYSNAEIEAMFDTFRCLAATEWKEDPLKYNVAVDRQTFDKCFVPRASVRPPPPNLVYDRIFAFYDTDADGLIGFEEYVQGVASIHKKKGEWRMKVFQGYDYDRNGFVDRKDFLRLFRAYYTLNKELCREMVIGMEEEAREDPIDIISSSQAISSAFQGMLPLGDLSERRDGKRRNEDGDYVLSDDQGVVREDGDETAEPNDVLRELNIPPLVPLSSTPPETRQTLREALETDLSTVEALQNSGTIQSTNAHGGTHLRNGTATGSDYWPPSNVREEDVETALGIRASLRQITNLPDRARIHDAAYRRREEERRRESQEHVDEHWERRQFYLDDENGVAPPAGFDKDENLQQSRQSRSSSKVRFEDDLTDGELETRSNTSVSSRSIPVGERWGGYEVPEAEKDVGREILYQVTQEGLNELLDPIFRRKEDLAIDVIRTKGEREQWRAEISRFATEEERQNIITNYDSRERFLRGRSGGWRTKSKFPDLNYEVIRALNGDEVRPSNGPGTSPIDNLLGTHLYHKIHVMNPHLAGKLTGMIQEMEVSDRILLLEDDSKLCDKVAEALAVYIDYINKESTAGKAAAAASFNKVPEAAADLHGAVCAFDEIDDSVIEGISEKPLGDLLAESGYATASSPPSTPADPTLPQNRPNQPPNNASMEASSAGSETQPTVNARRHQLAATAGNPASWQYNTILFPRSSVPTEGPSVADSESTTPNPIWTPKPPMTLKTASMWHRYFTTRPPNEQELRRYVYLDFIEAEGENRGGPGRVSYEEFVESVDGKGRNELEFVWRWIDMGLF